MAHVVLKDLVKTYGALQRRQQRVADGQRWRVRRARRPLGMRQDDDPQSGRGADPDHDRATSSSGTAWSTTSIPRTGTSQWCSRTTRSIRKSRSTRTWRSRCRCASCPRDEIDRKVKEAARVLDMTATPRAQASRALGRTTAARGPGPRPRPRPRGIPDGRAALQSRCQAARADAVRNQAVPSGPEGDDHLCDARPARSRDHGRQDGGDERRLSAAIRFAGAGFRPSREHVRRELHRQPGDEPYSARGIDGKRRHGADQRGRLEPRRCRNATRARSQKATTRKVVLGARHSTIKLHKSAVPGAIPAKAYTVEPTGDVTFVQVFLSGAIVNISVPPTSPSHPTSRSGSSSTRSACTCSTAKPKWPSRPTETGRVRLDRGVDD